MIRRAEAYFRASISSSSSMKWSFTGEQEVWMTKTSSSRTFSSTRTLMVSFGVRSMRTRPGGQSR